MPYGSSRTRTRIRGASLAFGLALLAPAAAVAQQHFPSGKDLTVGPADTDLERAMRVAQEPRRPVEGRGEIGLAWMTTNTTPKGAQIARTAGGVNRLATMHLGALSPDVRARPARDGVSREPR